VNLTVSQDGIAYLEVNISSKCSILSGFIAALPDIEPRFSFNLKNQKRF